MPFLNISSVLETRIKTDGIIINSVPVDILRLDQVHPVVSGNKLFKLSLYLQDAISSAEKRLITFGGAYSNHLHAAAFACKKTGIESIGIVRGEEIAAGNATLRSCEELGMQLHFVSRKEYREWAGHPNEEVISRRFGKGVIVPAGGYGPQGAAGASRILQLIPEKRYTHICLPTGTATTLAGILSAERTETVMAFPALKGMHDIPKRLQHLGVTDISRLRIEPGFHFGGFAKTTPELINFMNNFFSQHNLPLDFVYTGKMMFGIHELICQNRIPVHARILAIHTGGLQGNKSLPAGTLHY